MKKYNLFFRLALILVLLFPAVSGSEKLQPDMLLTGVSSSQLSVTLISPEYLSLAQYGEERIESLNRLMKHISLETGIDGSGAAAVFCIDQEPLFSVYESVEENNIRTCYSFIPDIALENSLDEEKTGGYSTLHDLETHFFRINRLLDSFYSVFGKCPGAFPELVRNESVSLNFRKIGKAVRRITIRFSADYVRDSFPGALSALTDSEEERKFIEQCVFEGSQRIMLLYDKDNKLIRISYDGTAGLSPEMLRRISVNWKCLRDDQHKIDDLTLKTPAVKGYDKYNLVYARELDQSDPEHQVMVWDYELDLRENDIRQKIQYKSEILYEQGSLTGTMTFAQKQDGKEEKTTLAPSLKKENEGEYKGSLEITDYSGKIIYSRVRTGLIISSGRDITAPDKDAARVISLESSARKEAEEEIQDRLASVLVSRLITLPAEDLDFFSRDIPEGIWNSIIQSLY